MLSRVVVDSIKSDIQHEKDEAKQREIHQHQQQQRQFSMSASPAYHRQRRHGFAVPESMSPEMLQRATTSESMRQNYEAFASQISQRRRDAMTRPKRSGSFSRLISEQDQDQSGGSKKAVRWFDDSVFHETKLERRKEKKPSISSTALMAAATTVFGSASARQPLSVSSDRPPLSVSSASQPLSVSSLLASTSSDSDGEAYRSRKKQPPDLQQIVESKPIPTSLIGVSGQFISSLIVLQSAILGTLFSEAGIQNFVAQQIPNFRMTKQHRHRHHNRKRHSSNGEEDQQQQQQQQPRIRRSSSSTLLSSFLTPSPSVHKTSSEHPPPSHESQPFQATQAEAFHNPLPTVEGESSSSPSTSNRPEQQLSTIDTRKRKNNRPRLSIDDQEMIAFVSSLPDRWGVDSGSDDEGKQPSSNRRKSRVASGTVAEQVLRRSSANTPQQQAEAAGGKSGMYARRSTALSSLLQRQQVLQKQLAEQQQQGNRKAQLLQQQAQLQHQLQQQQAAIAAARNLAANQAAATASTSAGGEGGSDEADENALLSGSTSATTDGPIGIGRSPSDKLRLAAAKSLIVAGPNNNGGVPSAMTPTSDESDELQRQQAMLAETMKEQAHLEMLIEQATAASNVAAAVGEKSGSGADGTCCQQMAYNCHNINARSVKNCVKKTITFLFSQLGLCLMVCSYCFFGGLIFQKIERQHELDLVAEQRAFVRQEMKAHADMLWNLTEQLDVFYPEQWREEAVDVMLQLIDRVHARYRERPDWRLVRLNSTGEQLEEELQWSIPGALLFSVTVITTIGYGHITPKTNLGRMVCIGYALFGIPLMFLCLANIGNFFASVFRLTWRACNTPICRRRREKKQRSAASELASVMAGGDPRLSIAALTNASQSSPKMSRLPSMASTKSAMPDLRRLSVRPSGGIAMPAIPDDTDELDESTALMLGNSPTLFTDKFGLEQPYAIQLAIPDAGSISRSKEKQRLDQVSVPISLCLLVIVAYIMGGAMLFTLWEHWTFLEGAYFCFVTLSTIGFGDFVPGTADKDGRIAEEKLIVLALWLLIGLSVISMCLGLVQEEVKNKVRRFGQKIGIIARDEDS